MIVCVYGAASSEIDKNIIDKVYSLGKTLAEKGHALIYGAGSTGVMGAAARGFKSGGAFVHGVIPKFFEENDYEGIFYDADKITYTETMAERKQIMEDGCEAFIIAPGGIGTLEELFQVLTLKQLGRHKKAIALFNIDGFYDGLLDFLDTAIEKGFINEEVEDLFAVLETEEEIINYIENYSSANIKWHRLKKK